MKNKTDSLCVSPSWKVSPSVRVLTTTRVGGVSKAPFNSMNLGLHVGDEHAHVLENRRLLASHFSLPSEPVWLNQTHSAKVLEVHEDSLADNHVDGAFTRKKQLVLAVLTADCLPVVISDVKGHQLAVVHAGWRGLAGGIVSEALSNFTQGTSLHAWLGPAIGPSKFEVGEDVRTAFIECSQANEEFFTAGNAPGEYWADLYALAAAELRSAGCTVTGGEYCTYTQKSLFHSHRRDGVASGRMVTLAWMS